MRIHHITATALSLLALGSWGCRQKIAEPEFVLTEENQKECILRALSLVFGPGGMQDVRGRYSGGKPITVAFSGFPLESYPDQFEDHQLVPTTPDGLKRLMEKREPLPYLILHYKDGRPQRGLNINIHSDFFRWNHENNMPFEGGDEFALIEFQPVQGRLDSGTIALKGIQ